ncbi:MAG: NAD(P)H-dependent oxidoreductase [Legionellales bacterium]|nr:NAD(P)H-dependent oxidoreductase [Legionellales bacterium]
MKLFMMSASIRKDSYNKKLIKNLAGICRKNDIMSDISSIEDFPLPFYDGDAENAEGIPKAAEQFVQRMHDSDATVISSPEYNFSTPGILKNLIDWVSRVKDEPFSEQNIFLMSASPSLVGGNRGLWATRIPLESCGAFVYPRMYSLASAGTAFNEADEFKETKNSDFLEKMFLNFIKSIE